MRHPVHAAAIAELHAMSEAVFSKSVKRVMRKMRRRIENSVIAAGEEFSIDELAFITSLWNVELVEEILPFIDEIFTAGAMATEIQLPEALRSEIGEDAAARLREFVNRHTLRHLADARNRLRDFGDEMWAEAREELMRGVEAGEEIVALGNRLTSLLDILDSQARTVARTEVVSAANGGALAEMSAYSSAGLGPATKIWIATADDRTRPWHLDADGDEVPIDEPFDVGGDELMFPGDPDGSAENVVNCRCTIGWGEAEADPAGDTVVELESGDVETISPDELEQEMEELAGAGGPMPYEVKQNADGCPTDTPWGVVNSETAEVMGCHSSEADAQQQMEALYANVPDAAAALEDAGFHALLVEEGIATGDGREFEPNALVWRDLPIPIKWQIAEATAHDGCVLVGRIDRIERQGTEIHGWGVFDLGGADGIEAHRLVKENFLRGVSVDVDDVSDADIELIWPAEEPGVEPGLEALFAEPEKVLFHHGRIAGATLTPMPAFQEAFIELTSSDGSAAAVSGSATKPAAPPVGYAVVVDLPSEVLAAQVLEVGSEFQEYLDAHLPEGMHMQFQVLLNGEPFEMTLQPTALDALVASAIPVEPPGEWFEDPGFAVPQRTITVTDEGRVTGHLFKWGECHVGFGDVCRVPPQNDDFSFFATGSVRTAEGAVIPVGQLTMGTGHADRSLTARPATAHYDNVDWARADVVIGEDAHGAWFSGALRPGTTPEQIRQLRAAGVSGDWRKIGGRLRLVAALVVNVRGFPIPQTAAGVLNGEQVSLVAAGMTEHTGLTPVAGGDRIAERIARSIGRDRKTKAATLAAQIGRE